MARRKKKKNYSKGIVIFIIVLNTVFTFACLFAFIKTSSEPSALIMAWFGFTTGELWLLSGIKKKKIDQQEEH